MATDQKFIDRKSNFKVGHEMKLSYRFIHSLKPQMLQKILRMNFNNSEVSIMKLLNQDVPVDIMLVILGQSNAPLKRTTFFIVT